MNIIVDYHAGNLFNLKNALDTIGVASEISSDPDVVASAERLLFPGVGAFGAAMESLQSTGLIAVLKEKIAAETPFLGICVGLQLLYETGEEGGSQEGLGIIPGSVQRFTHDLKIPHMGWNQVHHPGQDPLFSGIPDKSHFYFVHSYYGTPTEAQHSLATTDYGMRFTSAIRDNRVWGVQFHPEKSQDVGLQLLKNFCSLPV